MEVVQGLDTEVLPDRGELVGDLLEPDVDLVAELSVGLAELGGTELVVEVGQLLLEAGQGADQAVSLAPPLFVGGRRAGPALGGLGPPPGHDYPRVAPD